MPTAAQGKATIAQALYANSELPTVYCRRCGQEMDFWKGATSAKVSSTLFVQRKQKIMMESEDSSDSEWGQAWDKELPKLDDKLNYQTHLSGPACSLQNSKKIHDDCAVATDSHTDVTLMSRMLLNDNKAGMDGLDKQKINQIIFEASKGSKYYENEQKKEEHVNQRIAEQMRRIARLSEADLQRSTTQADKILSDLEARRDLARTIVHVDMDAYFAAVEMRDDSRLQNVPMAVGGSSMLSTSNYAARRFGVRAAMPGFIAKKLCPSLIIVPPNFDKYIAVSRDVRSVMEQYDAYMSAVSLDEAYLDITDHLQQRQNMGVEERTFTRDLTDQEICICPQTTSNKNSSKNVANNKKLEESTDPAKNDVLCAECLKLCEKRSMTVTFGLCAEEAVREMRFRIHSTTQLTASAGIGPNMMIAKVCSDKNKPNGQYMVAPTRESVMDFIKDLPIRKVCGVGKVTEKMLQAVDVVRCPDLYTRRGLLYLLYSSTSFNYFMRICAGIGSTTVHRDGERKSISVERTFSEINKPAELFKKCYELSEALSEDLKEQNLMGKTVTLKLKLSNFEVRTRASTLLTHVCEAEAIYNAARDILRLEIQGAAPEPLRLRLMGVRLSNLINKQDVQDQKQETITGLFQKLHSKSHSESRSTSPVNIECNSSGLRSNAHHFEGFSSEYQGTELADETSMQDGGYELSCELDHVSILENKYQVAIATDENVVGSVETSVECTEPVSVFGMVSYVKSDSYGMHNAEIFKDFMIGKSTEDIGRNSKHSSACSGEKYSSINSHLLNESNLGDNRAVIERNSVSMGASTVKESQNVASVVEHNEACTAVNDSQYVACDPEQSNSVLSDISKHASPCENECLSSYCKTASCRDSIATQDYECPICLETIRSSDMEKFTEHLDQCLAVRCVEDENKCIKNTVKQNSVVVSNMQSTVNQSVVADKSQELVSDKCTPTAEEGTSRSIGADMILVCPICNAPQRKSDLYLFNQHVDFCLNRQTIRDIIQEPDKIQQNRQPNKRQAVTPGQSSVKKPRTETPDRPKKTLLSYFQSKPPN